MPGRAGSGFRRAVDELAEEKVSFGCRDPRIGREVSSSESGRACRAQSKSTPGERSRCGRPKSSSSRLQHGLKRGIELVDGQIRLCGVRSSIGYETRPTSHERIARGPPLTWRSGQTPAFAAASLIAAIGLHRPQAANQRRLAVGQLDMDRGAPSGWSETSTVGYGSARGAAAAHRRPEG